jgi:uncharacterized repeat protein (TIGR01451 family)
MFPRRQTVLAIAILFLVALAVFATFSLPFGSKFSYFSGSSNPYSENLAVYLTSNEAYWSANLLGGNISLGSGFSLPSGVTGFSLTLTHYASWSPTFETFTKYGLGLLGPNEPMPNATLLTVDSSSFSAASTLATTLSQHFALVLIPYTNNATSFTFLSPSDFVTEMHVFFWKMLPSSAGGFASIMPESSYEAMDLESFTLSDTSAGFSINYGGLSPVSSSSFDLYSLLGVPSLNYSTSATSSAVQVHVLGGIATNANSSFTNTFSNFSSFASATKSAASQKVPDLNATLDFSFPVIVAYRQITGSPTTPNPLTPSTGGNDTVTVTVKNVSPSGSPGANVTVNDDWIKSLYPSDFTLSTAHGDTNASYTNMTSGITNSFVYSFTVGSSANGSYVIPAIPVTYTFKVANKTITETTALNTETISVGASNEPELESFEDVGLIQAAQALSLNVTVVNRGGGTAFLINGKNSSTLGPGATLTYNVTQSAVSLTSLNASIMSTVTWQNVNGISGNSSTNGVNAIYGFASPGSPGTSLSETVSLYPNKSALNVSLSLQNTGSNSLTNVSLRDSIPSGTIFSKSIGNTTVLNSGSLVYANVSLPAGAVKNFTYVLNITSATQNFVFMPANVSSAWNNVTVVHFSQGYGLPLGVLATKIVAPSYGFQGSNITEQLGIVNKGNLSVYQVSLSNSSDPFISVVKSTGTTVPILSPGQVANSTVVGYLTASPGEYNTSASAATFIFAGTNQTATSNIYKVAVFSPVGSVLSTVGSKIEENHAITIVIKFTNPSNVTVSNVKYSLVIPSYLTLNTPGKLTGTIASLGPGQTTNSSFVVQSNLPNQYTINGGNLTFQYGGQTLKGNSTGLTLNIVDDLTTRYAIPVGIGVVIIAATLLYVRRITKTRSGSTTVKSS